MSSPGREIIARVLLAFRVRFVVVGGVAAQLRGWSETTLDIDIVPDPDAENLARLARALDDLDVRWRVAGAPDGHPLAQPLDAETIMRHASLAFVCAHGPIDVVLHPDGVDGFAELAPAATTEQLSGSPVLVASAAHIVRLSGQPTASRTARSYPASSKPSGRTASCPRSRKLGINSGIKLSPTAPDSDQLAPL